MQIIDTPPYAPTLIESTRAIGYSLEAAMADIVDNSIAARATKIDIFFFPVGDEYVAILDNGIGMDETAINTAMQYGSKSPAEQRDKSDLGRFGLGLKTASLSQCKSLTVVSKQGSKLLGRRWDVDYVAKSGSWSLIVLDDEELKDLPELSALMQYENGCLVVWQNLDRMKLGEVDFEKTFGRKMDDVREHLALVYHRYLSGEAGLKKLTISLNGVRIIPADPFLSKKSTQAMDDEIIVIRGQRIVVRPYILPHITNMTDDEKNSLGGKEGLRKQQGFYIYRNKRLLVWGTWFRMMRKGDLSKLARVMVDIPNDLDDLWTLDIKKSSALPPAEVRSNLQSIVDRMAENSKRTWTFRGKKETSDAIDHVWLRFKTPGSGIRYEINRDNPLVEQIIEKFPEVKGNLEVLLRQIEKGIPLNQLYVDLNNDEKIDNDAEVTGEEVKSLIMQMMVLQQSDVAKKEFLARIEHAEPFCAFPDVISAIREKDEMS